jgi:hypothetical protein
LGIRQELFDLAFPLLAERIHRVNEAAPPPTN